MKTIIISSSLNPASKSYVLANYAEKSVQALGIETQFIDLREWDLPLSDGGAAYGASGVTELTSVIADASAIILAAPVYNFDVNAAAKNLIELTGRAWEDKPVGLLAAAGGQASYMSLMGLANSLMLDFRSIIVPRFVYATGRDFKDPPAGKTEIAETEIKRRIDELTGAVAQLGKALQQEPVGA